jgi:hypothetical protein
MIDLLVQAKVNFVWVTYSVGFSWRDEETQRVAVRELVKKLHAHGIKAAAYICAISIFWESLFKDDPQSVRWIMVGSDGVPYRYSDGRDVMRFVADIDSPGWVEYQSVEWGQSSTMVLMRYSSTTLFLIPISANPTASLTSLISS